MQGKVVTGHRSSRREARNLGMIRWQYRSVARRNRWLVHVIVNVHAGRIPRNPRGNLFIGRMCCVCYSPQHKWRGNLRVRSKSPPYAVAAVQKINPHNLEYIVRIIWVRTGYPLLKVGHAIHIGVIVHPVLTWRKIKLAYPCAVRRCNRCRA